MTMDKKYIHVLYKFMNALFLSNHGKVLSHASVWLSSTSVVYINQGCKDFKCPVTFVELPFDACNSKMRLARIAVAFTSV